MQDYKAEKTIESLKSLTAPESIVIRGGDVIKIQAHNLVPGDVVQLETGNIVSVPTFAYFSTWATYKAGSDY